MTPIDPMHNLFLGTAKHNISVWKTKLILNENDLLKIQEKIGNFFCPSDVGKLPQKMHVEHYFNSVKNQQALVLLKRLQFSVDWSTDEGIFVKKFKNGSLSEIESNRPYKMYSFLYGNENFQLCTSVKLGNELYMNGSVLGSKNSRSIRSSFILAFWSIGNGQLSHTCSDLSPHPGQIVNFLEHSIIMNGVKSHILARVTWFKGLDD